MAEPLWARFAAGAGREGPMTWGQRKIGHDLHDHPDDRYLAFLSTRIPIDPGTGFGPVTAALTGLLERHESLRTVFPRDSRQRVLAGGALAVRIVRADTGEDGHEAADRAYRMLSATPFEPAADLPVRAAVVVEENGPTVLVLALSHLAVDGIGVFVIRAEVAAAIADGGRTTAPEMTQPLDMAAEQSSPRGATRSRRALRHWETFYREAPAEMLPGPSGRDAAAYCEGRMTSSRLATALGEVAERTATSRSTVLLAAAAQLLAHRAGLDRCGLTSICANRANAAAATSVATLAQDAGLLVTTAGADFDELVRRTWKAALVGYAHSAVDPDAQRDLRDRVGSGRRRPFARDFVYSDMSWGSARPAELAPAGPQETRLSIDDAGYMWVRGYLTVYRLDGVADLSLWADERYLPRSGVASLLRELETAVCEAAASTVTEGAPA